MHFRRFIPIANTYTQWEEPSLPRRWLENHQSDFALSEVPPLSDSSLLTTHYRPKTTRWRQFSAFFRVQISSHPDLPNEEAATQATMTHGAEYACRILNARLF
ncbi:hypothetical protein C2E23DRAFT_289786 [Lenzites betulinus]|nr:hypothetical protein C2E23DRAFT_289786 [Lenzites betulinus]